MNLPTTKPNDRDLDWYIKECEWMQTELGKLKTENEIMRNRLNSLVSNNNKQTDEYICVDREHGLWKRKEPKEPNVNADRLALALSPETIQELERENAELRKKFMFAESEIILLREDREELRELAARMAKEMREIDHEFCSLVDYDNLQNKI